MCPSLPFADVAKASEKLLFTLSHTSSIGETRPLSAKNRIRCPENQVKTSSGVACTWLLIWAWKVPCATVFIFKVVPPFHLLKAALTSSIAFLGVGSHWLLPTVTRPPL